MLLHIQTLVDTRILLNSINYQEFWACDEHIIIMVSSENSLLDNECYKFQYAMVWHSHTHHLLLHLQCSSLAVRNPVLLMFVLQVMNTT